MTGKITVSYRTSEAPDGVGGWHHFSTPEKWNWQGDDARITAALLGVPPNFYKIGDRIRIGPYTAQIVERDFACGGWYVMRCNRMRGDLLVALHPAKVWLETLRWRLQLTAKIWGLARKE